MVFILTDRKCSGRRGLPVYDSSCSNEVAPNELPSTRDVSSVTLAALRLPAGKFRPIFSSFSLKHFPPFLDFALKDERNM